MKETMKTISYIVSGVVFAFALICAIIRPERTDLSIIVVLIALLGLVCCSIGIDISDKK